MGTRSVASARRIWMCRLRRTRLATSGYQPRKSCRVLLGISYQVPSSAQKLAQLEAATREFIDAHHADRSRCPVGGQTCRRRVPLRMSGSPGAIRVFDGHGWCSIAPGFPAVPLSKSTCSRAQARARRGYGPRTRGEPSLAFASLSCLASAPTAADNKSPASPRGFQPCESMRMVPVRGFEPRSRG